MKNTQVRGILNIVIIAILTIILAIGALIYFLFNGNPVERYKTRGKAINYLAEKYPNTKFKVEKTFFNFKDISYNAKVKSENKMQTEFYVVFHSKNNVSDDYIDKKFSQELNLNIEPKVRKIITNANTSIRIFSKEGRNYDENNELSKEMKNLDISLTIKWDDKKLTKESFAKKAVDVVNELNKEGFNVRDYFFVCSDGIFLVTITEDQALGKSKLTPEELIKENRITSFFN